jgi:hypothetical protein
MEHAFLDAGYPNLQKDKDGKIVPKPADTKVIKHGRVDLVIMVIRHHGVRSDRSVPGRCSRPRSATPHVAALHIGNGWFGGMRRCSPPRSSRQPATSMLAFVSIGVALMTVVIGAMFLRDTRMSTS